MKKTIALFILSVGIIFAARAQIVGNACHLDEISYYFNSFNPDMYRLKDTLPPQCKKASSDNDYKFGPEGGLVYQKGLYGELGIAYSNNSLQHDVNVLIDIFKLDAQYNFSSTSPILVPRASFELNLVTLVLRSSFEDFTNFKINDYRFTPELGITFLGTVSLSFGWNIPLTPTRVNNVGAHILSLTYTYHKGFVKENFKNQQ